MQAALDDLERPDLNGDALDQACARMQALVAGLSLPGALLEQVCVCVGEGGRGAGPGLCPHASPGGGAEPTGGAAGAGVCVCRRGVEGGWTRPAPACKPWWRG